MPGADVRAVVGASVSSVNEGCRACQQHASSQQHGVYAAQARKKRSTMHVCLRV
jgi:hypothetical protein